jgi:hypothetical protein
MRLVEAVIKVCPGRKLYRSTIYTMLLNIKNAITAVVDNTHVSKQILIEQEFARLRSDPRYDNPKSLTRFGYKVYSQNDEDGIIRTIFQRIGATSNTFVEFGIGDGLENNTLALLFDGWTGLWIDGSAKHIAAIRQSLPQSVTNGDLKVVDAFITRDNINDLISNSIDRPEIDLLSVDIDGNDYHVLKAITCVTPRVIVIEYNAKFRPPTSFCMDYDSSHIWTGGDCFGASLKFLEEHLAGYALVGCNLTGSNAFFVREDLVGDCFLEPFTAENHYEPARYYLSSAPSGQLASFKAIEKSFTMRRPAG